MTRDSSSEEEGVPVTSVWSTKFCIDAAPSRRPPPVYSGSPLRIWYTRLRLSDPRPMRLPTWYTRLSVLSFAYPHLWMLGAKSELQARRQDNSSSKTTKTDFSLVFFKLGCRWRAAERKREKCWLTGVYGACDEYRSVQSLNGASGCVCVCVCAVLFLKNWKFFFDQFPFSFGQFCVNFVIV